MRRSGASGGRFGGDGDTEDGHGGSGGGGILGCTEGPVCYIKLVERAAGPSMNQFPDLLHVLQVNGNIARSFLSVLSPLPAVAF